MKLLSYLAEIHPDEMYRLKRYIHADYFNTNERLKVLFDAIRTSKTDNISYEEIDLTKVYKRIFSKSKRSTMNDDLSGLLKLVRGFMSQEQYNEDKSAHVRYLLRGLESRKAKHKFKLLVNRESGNYEGGNKIDRFDSRENYLHDMLIAQEKFWHYTVYENRKSITNKALQELMYTIDRFYLISKMNFGGIMFQRTLVMQHNFDYGIVSDFQTIIRRISVEQFPLLHIKYYMYAMWKGEKDGQFDQCKNILLEYGGRFSLYEQRNLLQALINFCRISVNGTQPQVWNERQLELYTQYFEQGLCYTGIQQNKKFISLHHFKNYMQLLIELNDFDQFKRLEKKYRPQVYYKNKGQKRFVNQYNSTALYIAQYLYYGKNKRTIGEEFAYDTAFQHIQNMEQELSIGKQEYPDIFYRILYEVLVLKIYYDQPSGFAGRRSAFKKYVKNLRQINIVFLKPYLNFADVILKLYRLKSKPKNTAELKQLKNSIEDMRIVERVWLGDKLEGI